MEDHTPDREDLIEGRNAVQEALRAGRPIDKLFVARGDTDRALGRLVAKARQAGIVVSECDRRKLDAMSATGAHQGVIAQAAVREYCDLEDILALAEDRGEPPFLVVCDEIADPHNLGAILRTAECAGAHGVVIPKRRRGRAHPHRPGAKHPRRPPGAEGPGRVGLRYRGGRSRDPLGDGYAGACVSGDRIRGIRHGAAGGGVL